MAGDTGWNVSDCLYQLAPDCLSVVKAKRVGHRRRSAGHLQARRRLLPAPLASDRPEHERQLLSHGHEHLGTVAGEGNIAQGEHSANTFLTQTMDVVPVVGKEGRLHLDRRQHPRQP